MHNFRALPKYKKRIVISYMKCLLFTEKVEYYVVNLPNLILTPRGLVINRRKHRRIHLFPERRFTELVWRELQLLLYREDETRPTRS